jgi:hypothetical protein
MTTQFTIASTPPTVQKRRFSSWDSIFEECRTHQGEWRQAVPAMTKSTAMQLASDIRNAYRRTNAKSRLRGLRPTERWDAAWGEVDGKFHVWLQYQGEHPAEQTA